VAKGFDSVEARRRAHLEMGGIERSKEECRDMRKVNWLHDLAQDVRYGLRVLRKSPGFTFVAVLTLGLGMGATTAIFSVVYGVLLRPLAYAEPERIVQLAWDFGDWQGSLNDQQFRFFAEQSKTYQHIAAATSASFTLVGGDQPARVSGQHVTAEYFEALGVTPAMGRRFLPEEDAGNGERVTVLSHGLWERRFAGQSDIIGRSIRLNGDVYTVIGVMPAGFDAIPPTDLWVPLAAVAKQVGQGANYTVLARLRPGVTRMQAQAEATVLTEAYRKSAAASNLPQRAGGFVGVFPYRELIAGDVRTPLLVLFGAVGLVLLIACANVANLLVARTTGRVREISIRLAMGASRGRVVRQMVTEGLALSLAGAGVGLIVGYGSMKALLVLAPGNLMRQGEVRLDGPVLVFALVLSVWTGVLFSVAPALRATRANLNAFLKEGTWGTTAGVSRGRLRSTLVVGEVAVSLLLLVGAGLLIRTFANLRGTNAGFDMRPVYALQVWLAGSESKTTQQIALLSQALVERISGLPGVESAAVVGSGLPLLRGGNIGMVVEGKSEDEIFSGDVRIITPGYFKTLGIPLLSGRLLSDGDTENAPPVMIINEALARSRFAGENPIGKRIWVNQTAREIVGVVGDVRSEIAWKAPPCGFLPVAQTPIVTIRLFEGWFPSHVLVRASGEPEQLAKSVEQAVRETAPQIPTGRGRSMTQVLSASLANERFQMTLLATFAGLAMLLAAVGLYGVISQTMAERTHEIGLRIALGAHPADILRMMLRQAMVLVGMGIALGLGGALAWARVLKTLLYGVTARDPLSYGGVVIVLLVVGLAACYVPARRAMRVDPMVALRHE
jgi:predicted permease